MDLVELMELRTNRSKLVSSKIRDNFYYTNDVENIYVCILQSIIKMSEEKELQTALIPVCDQELQIEGVMNPLQASLQRMPSQIKAFR